MMKKRFEIMKAILSNGIEFGNFKFVPLLEMARQINSTRNAKYFVWEKEREESGEYVDGFFMVYPQKIAKLYTLIRQTARKNQIQLKRSYGSNTEYVIAHVCIYQKLHGVRYVWKRKKPTLGRY